MKNINILKNKVCVLVISRIKLIKHYITDRCKNDLEIIRIFKCNEYISNKHIWKILKDLYFSIIYYRITPVEYFIYNFEELSDEGRKQYIGNSERHEILDKIGDNETREILNNKYNCYLKFKKYYKRDIIMIDGEKDKCKFDKFCKKNSEFIVKPINQSSGRGIYKLKLDKRNNIKEVWGSISKEKVLLEEMLEQVEELKQLHPESVNTIRITTYIKNNNVTKVYAILRMGQGESIIDNAGAGGIVGLIDMDTGILKTIGKSKKTGKVYIKHPDTNIILPGFQIPKWKELCELVDEVARIVPKHNYIAWDFALTEKGWCIVEANAEGEFTGPQMLGLRYERNI